LRDGYRFRWRDLAGADRPHLVSHRLTHRDGVERIEPWRREFKLVERDFGIGVVGKKLPHLDEDHRPPCEARNIP